MSRDRKPRDPRRRKPARSSRLSGFFRLTERERLIEVAAFSGIDPEALAALDKDVLPQSIASLMSENVVGRFTLPISFAPNFRVNGHDYIVPMVIEEPSVVAAASFAARLLRAGEGIVAKATPPVMIGQLHFPDPPPAPVIREALERHQDELAPILAERHPRLVAAGGGYRGFTVRRLMAPNGREIAVVHLLVDVRDAMGANAVNSMSEAVAPLLAEWTGARIGLKILSNLNVHRRVHVEGRVALGDGRGESRISRAEAQRIEEASLFAEADPFRAVTANKGVMNGIDAVLLATGQDFRAVEAAAHAFAAHKGQYTSLTRWRVDGDALVGTMDIPMALGTVGGATKVHPGVRACIDVLHVEGASELACVVAAVGLAQNLAATRALASEGIQQGHMRLHARKAHLEDADE